VTICVIFSLSFYFENDIFVYSLYNLGIVCLLSGMVPTFTVRAFSCSGEFTWGVIHIMLGFVLFPGADFIPLWMSEVWLLFVTLITLSYF
jgi:hypothetical protein